MPPLKTEAVANWFLDKAALHAQHLDPMKLQKLIFFAQGWTLALMKEPLVDELFEAWEYGPVLPSLYHEFKDYGSRAILRRSTYIDVNRMEPVEPKVPRGSDVVRILEKVWDVYGALSGVRLSSLTHQTGGAWDKIRQTEGQFRNKTIPNELIREEFDQKVVRRHNQI